MSGFFWNVRGLNKSSKHSVIKKWVEGENFQFGCVLETRVQERKAVKVLNKVFNDWSVLTNYEYNRLGRIWVVWRPNVRLTPFFKSGQVITCSVKLEGEDSEFFCSFIYASNFDEERRDLWNDLRAHYDSPIIRNKPWMLLGDFNVILDVEEHSRADSSNFSHGMQDFQDLVNYCHLSDLAAQGPLYTWCNRRDTDLISKKLDRILVNDQWNQSFPHSYTVFEAGGCSDHLRSKVKLRPEIGGVKKRRPFKFVNAVTTLEEFKPTISDYWSNT